jgi:hypothetical protein
MAALRRVAAELPEGSVDGLSIICRAPNGFPLPPDGRVVPLHELPARWAR